MMQPINFNVLQLLGDFDVGTFLKNSTSTLQGWAGLAIGLLGVVAVFIGVWQIVTGLISHGKKQTNWAVAIILLLVGGALIGGGWTLVSNIAKGGKKTIEDLGNGSGKANTIVPFLSSINSFGDVWRMLW